MRRKDWTREEEEEVMLMRERMKIGGRGGFDDVSCI